ncbi:cystathionine beta-lyase [Lactobacillus colini]|uniref:cysteine-S-conjugate beta-lyase n=1 Tax=Lactobacillus colini TaxID=1819254 RepID=A0ABS4MFR5_9LACO|nr:aminotransferase class I/II-fold pyridoxal phosphate-dependent enzyme [Lactobacillus colini]MBP2058217.1 cystathionine beta-lyase [Lactobacillus colini]
MIKKYNFDKVVNRYGTYSTQWDFVKDRFGKENLLPFTISDMDFKVPEGVTETIINAAKRGLFGYTRWNNPDLKSSISNWYQYSYDCDIDVDWIVYSPSVIFSLAKLIEQFSKPGDKIATLSPCYDAFIKTIEANDRKLIEFKITEKINFDKLESFFSQEYPSIFVLCNPENPMGIAWSKDDLMEFVRLCNAYNVNIISDEIHLDIVRKGVKKNSLAELFSKLTVHSAVITSATKAFNTPSLIFSYALIPDELDRLTFLHTLRAKNALSSTSYLGMLVLIDCYNNERDWLNQLNEYIDDNFKLTKNLLKERLNIDYKIPDATYLSWIDISPLKIPMNVLQDNMINKQNVAIMDGQIYGNGGTNYLRFNEGAPQSKIKDGLERFIKAVEELKHRN